MPIGDLLRKSAMMGVIVTAVCVLLYLDAPGGVPGGAWGDLFTYRRGDILAGEYWRLISGHFVHVTAPHLLLNLAAWLLIWGYGLSACNTLTWLALLLFCSIGTGAGLLVLQPEVEWYTGLSGVLHGLFIAVAVLRLLAQRDDYPSWLILGVIGAKLVYEYFQGPTPMTAEWVGLQVIAEAHWYGALSGVLTVAVIGLFRVRRAAARA